MEKRKKEQLELKLKKMLADLNRSESSHDQTVAQSINPVVIRRRKAGLAAGRQ